MNEGQKAEFLAYLTTTGKLNLWLHRARGDTAAISSASSLMKELLGDEAKKDLDPSINEMVNLIEEKAQDLLDLMDVLYEHHNERHTP